MVIFILKNRPSADIGCNFRPKDKAIASQRSIFPRVLPPGYIQEPKTRPRLQSKLIGVHNDIERRLPMRRRSATLTLVFALCAIVTLTILNSKASAQDADYEKAVAHATQIIKTKILPQYETKDGFNVKPMDIKYDSDPTIAKFLDEFGSIWKQLDPIVAKAHHAAIANPDRVEIRDSPSRVLKYLDIPRVVLVDLHARTLCQGTKECCRPPRVW
jgi:hypothetical protein